MKYAPSAPPAQEKSSAQKTENERRHQADRRHPRADTRYVACLSKPPDFSKSAFIIESNGATFTPFEQQFLQNVAAAIRVNGKYPDLVEPAVSHFPFEMIINLAVRRDMATMPNAGRA
jgi:hypothetical protein